MIHDPISVLKCLRFQGGDHDGHMAHKWRRTPCTHWYASGFNFVNSLKKERMFSDLNQLRYISIIFDYL